LKSTSFEKAFALFLGLKSSQLILTIKNLKKKSFTNWMPNFFQKNNINFNLFLTNFKINQKIVKLSFKLKNNNNNVILTKIQKSLMLFNSNLLVAKYNQKI
jgi:hypothetical protein